jgi:hypothetical protein
MENVRFIDTIDGEVKCRECYDIDNGVSFLEFSLKVGYNEEFDPYEYVGECDVINKSLSEFTNEELEDLYLQVIKP